MSAILYYPELNEEKPLTMIEARLSYYGKHFFIKTRLHLNGRGITFLENDNGINRYKVTINAFKALEEKYSTCIKCYLD